VWWGGGGGLCRCRMQQPRLRTPHWCAALPLQTVQQPRLRTPHADGPTKGQHDADLDAGLDLGLLALQVCQRHQLRHHAAVPAGVGGGAVQLGVGRGVQPAASQRQSHAGLTRPHPSKKVTRFSGVTLSASFSRSVTSAMQCLGVCFFK